jgi:predicted MFS family arabinose efflux permease
MGGGQQVTFREVFADREYTALWTAQLVSIAGDQFARVALAVLVYNRTGSAALAAVTFAVTAGAMFLGGLLLGWTADRFPRRALMVTCDLACTGLVLVMTVPGLPVPVLLVLLFTVTLAMDPFISARSATNQAALGPERFTLGNAITISTYQAAQLGGTALGGIVAATAGVRAALLLDAGTFAVSAVLIRAGVKSRPPSWVTDGTAAAGPERPHLLAGFREMLTHPAVRTALLLMCVAGFITAPEGVVVPLSRQLGGGTVGVGWLLTAMAAGATAGPLLLTRLVPPDRQLRLTAVLATAACAVLTLFVFSPPLAAAAGILVISALFTGYIAVASTSIYTAVPDSRRGQAGGVIGAAMALSQGTGILAAGVAAQHFSPGLVVACAGEAGAITALLLALSWYKVQRPVTSADPVPEVLRGHDTGGR